MFCLVSIEFFISLIILFIEWFGWRVEKEFSWFSIWYQKKYSIISSYRLVNGWDFDHDLKICQKLYVCVYVCAFYRKNFKWLIVTFVAFSGKIFFCHFICLFSSLTFIAFIIRTVLPTIFKRLNRMCKLVELELKLASVLQNSFKIQNCMQILFHELRINRWWPILVEMNELAGCTMFTWSVDWFGTSIRFTREIIWISSITKSLVRGGT